MQEGRGSYPSKEIILLERIGREIMRAKKKKKPGLNAAKTKRATAAPDLRILSLYDDAAEGMNDFYLSLSLAVRQESWESSVAHVNASTVSWEYIFHVTQQSLLSHLRNCKLCVVTGPRFVSRFYSEIFKYFDISIPKVSEMGIK